MPSIDQRSKKISIIGAGPVGSLLAIQLCKRGFEVDLFESRADIRKAKVPAGRSINLALSTRGIYALERMGLEKKILKNAIPMKGRMIHDLKGQCIFSPYGIDDSQYINSISRAEINRALLDEAEKTPGCRVFFEHRLSEYDFQQKLLIFEQKDKGQNETTRKTLFSDCVIGSDGTNSALRKSIDQASGERSSESLLNYAYKEITLPPLPSGQFQTEANALHIWPRGPFMLIALPNVDGSFTCTLFLPFEASSDCPYGFNQFDESAEGRNRFVEFFKSQFPDLYPKIPDLIENFYNNPIGKMVNVHSKQWNLGSQALLIGDAAHAIVPFFGQGLNCSFEDCTRLDEILEKMSASDPKKELDLEMAFTQFFQNRKPDADAISQLAHENFIEMRDKVAQPRFLLEKEIEKRLMKTFPNDYTSRYAMVTFSNSPYRWALEAGKAQDLLLEKLSKNISKIEELDLKLAEKLVSEYASTMKKYQQSPI